MLSTVNYLLLSTIYILHDKIVVKLTNSDVQEAEVDESSDVVVEPAKTIPVHDRSVIYFNATARNYGLMRWFY